MKKLRADILAQILSFIIIAVFAIPINVNADFIPDQQTGTTVNIQHTSINFFVPEHRIRLQAEITDPAGIKLARTYFRAAGEADYVFVPMQSLKENVYEAVLPKPSKDTQTLEYILLAVNQKGQIVKTEVFRIRKNDDKEVPGWQKVVSEGEIKVSTELTQAPPTVSGFTDSITLDAVESSARFGTAVGIYLLLQGDGSDEAVKTDSADAAEKAGLSNNAIIGISAAVIGGGVALGFALRDDDDAPSVETAELSPDLSRIIVRFSKRMDRSVVPSSAVRIKVSPDSAEPWIAGTPDWTDDFTLSIPIASHGSLSPGDTVKLILDGGVFKDVDDNYMDNTYESSTLNEGNVTVTW